MLAVLVALTASLFPASIRLAQRARVEQATHELRVIVDRVGQYRDALGGLPRIQSPLELMWALKGRIDPMGRLINHPWFLDACWLSFENVNDKTVGTAILDPWGRPYLCSYVPAADGQSEAFVVVSAGADGQASIPGLWARDTAGSAPEDADNLALWVGSVKVVGRVR